MLSVWSGDGLVSMATVWCGDLGKVTHAATVSMQIPGSGLVVTLGSCSGSAMSVFFFFFYIPFSRRQMCNWGASSCEVWLLAGWKTIRHLGYWLEQWQEEISMWGHAQTLVVRSAAFRAWGSFISLKKRQPGLPPCCLSCQCAHQAGAPSCQEGAGLYALAPSSGFLSSNFLY